MGFKYNFSWTFFTTNYDSCIESFWDDAFHDTNQKLDTGFPEKYLEPDSFLEVIGNKYGRPSGHLRLVKLHGSTTWLVRKDNGRIEQKEYNYDQARNYFGAGSKYTGEIVIYPLFEKQLYLEPYIQMFYCLNKELANKKVWIVVGYSFRDAIIKNIFKTNLENSSKRMILVHPHAEDIIREHFHDYKQKVTGIAQRFGENNYERVNVMISNALIQSIT